MRGVSMPLSFEVAGGLVTCKGFFVLFDTNIVGVNVNVNLTFLRTSSTQGQKGSSGNRSYLTYTSKYCILSRTTMRNNKDDIYRSYRDLYYCNLQLPITRYINTNNFPCE